MYNHAGGTVQFPATLLYNAPGQGCTTAATYSGTALVLGRAIPTDSGIKPFQVFLACIIRQSPGLGSSKTRPGGLLRESHPSEDLSELPPLRDPALAGLWLGRGTIVGG